MKREILVVYVILLLSIAARNTVSQEEFIDWVMQDDLNTTFQEPAVCGDGVCEGIEKGVCPQDCGSTSEHETATPNKTVITQEAYGIIMVVFSPIAFIGVVALVLYTLSRTRKQKASEETGTRTDEEHAILDARDYIKRGYREEDVLRFLVEKGFTEEEAKRIIWDAKKELFS